MKHIDEFYVKEEEPAKSIFLALRSCILSLDKHITHQLKYGMPFFLYKGKMFCYLWKDKITKEPYIGIVEGNKIHHNLLEKGNRARMKILRIPTKEDIPVEIITQILNEALDLYRNGIVKIK